MSFKRKPTRTNKKKGPFQNLKVSSKTLKLFLVVIVVASIAIPLSIGLGLYSMYILTPPTTPSEEGSTFTLYNSVSGVAVSDVEIDILVSIPTETFAEEADLFNVTKFESFDAPTVAEDINLDMTDIDYAWIIIDPDDKSNYETTYLFIIGGINYNYTIEVYYLTSTVSPSMVERDALTAITLEDFGTSGNYTIFMNCPFGETGTRCQAPLLNPSDATETSISYEDALSGITNAFAIQFTFNATVNITNTAEIEITIDDSKVTGSVLALQATTPDEYIYLVFTRELNFASGVKQIGLELEFGEDIGIDGIASGRLEIPGNALSPGTLIFTGF